MFLLSFILPSFHMPPSACLLIPLQIQLRGRCVPIKPASEMRRENLTKTQSEKHLASLSKRLHPNRNSLDLWSEAPQQKLLVL